MFKTRTVNEGGYIDFKNLIIILFVLVLVSIPVVIPFNMSQFWSETNLDLKKINEGDYDGEFLLFDGNRLSSGSIVIPDINLDDLNIDVDVSGLVPYVGADKDLDLGSNILKTSKISVNSTSDFSDQPDAVKILLDDGSFRIRGTETKNMYLFQGFSKDRSNSSIGIALHYGLSSNYEYLWIAAAGSAWAGQKGSMIIASSTNNSSVAPAKPLYIHAQNKLDTTRPNLFLNNAGNVGVYTNSATEKLHVNGNIAFKSNNQKILFGSNKQSSITYDGNNMVVNPKESGNGVLNVKGTASASVLEASGPTDYSRDAPLIVHQPSEDYWTALFYNDVYNKYNPQFSYYGYNNGDFAMGTEVNTDLLFYTDGYYNERMKLTKDGHLQMLGNGTIQANGYKSSDGSIGATGSFISGDGKTITVKNGLIVGIN